MTTIDFDRVGTGDVPSFFSLALMGGGSNVVTLAAFTRRLKSRLNSFGSRIAAVSGSSAGGLVALATAFEVDDDVIENQIEGAVSRNRLLDGSLLLFPFRWNYGAGKELRRNAELLLGGRKLGEAKMPVVVIVGDRTTGEPVQVASWSHPDVDVVDLACATAAIPRLFKPVKIRGIGDNHEYVDGGTAVNMPAFHLDGLGYPVISATLVDRSEFVKPPENVIDEIKNEIRLFGYGRNHGFKSSHKLSRSVEIDAEDWLDFALTHEDCKRRREKGRWAANYMRLSA